MSNQSLHLKQSQSLVMTQQLQQSIKLLQYSSAELAEFVGDEIERNPMLEEGDGRESEPHSSDNASGENASEDAGQGASAEAHAESAESNIEAASETLDTNDDAIWGGEVAGEGAASRYSEISSGAGSGSAGGGGSFLADTIEQRLSEAVSLKDHVLRQMPLLVEAVADRLVASYLIDLLDDSGYMRESVAKVADHLGSKVEEVERVLLQLQECDPAGVFARDLTECLRLQLQDKDRLDPCMDMLIQHLALVEQGKFKELAKHCSVSEEEVREMLAELRHLGPRPGADFAAEEAQTLVPDVFVRRGPEGQWRVELNNDALPKVLVNRHYHAELSLKARDKKEKKFLNENLAEANWLLKALDQRANTLLKVSSEIVKQQRRFFEYGVHFLRPMTLQDIATEVELHESSISRVTTNKYISTGRGVFELKYFFSSSLGGASGEGEYSSRSVMVMIEEIVDAEAPNKILSDDKIVGFLKQRGVDVARRTVVKYRTKMNIPSSVQRRREKAHLISS